ncbi:MAG TPA: ribonuclease E/G, partial [Rhizomicrobium sp.]|nr:ribonuclease E/G [Rhizomicrobium sp.]
RPSQRWVRRRHYKIQEVIKRKQIMLVQVVKEERGTKGAALTTYLSLAGRYCVLMPNTPRGGGISRKITNLADRNRLKAAAATLELPEGMGLIIRTAGANRTKLEIKRDYEYLLRMWDQIRELTLQSNAPACVYEEGDIVKRAIRDLYNKDVSEILVEGEDGYRNAKEFMRMLMPSHAKNVKLYRDAVPLFQKYHIEAQLDAMFQPTVTLKSGGYIVINQTEALVSIDVNSGRATREHSIEETAHKTNLEAADEIGRQLRLRDLAGLIVIDFIDMEDSRNDRDVEKRLRDAVKNDRARVQIGKISQFGLLEMSRQRLRAGVVAGSTVLCPHCGGQGIVRSVESTALRVLRALEEEGQRGRAAAIVVHVANEVALYALNQKRRELARVETDYDMAISFEPKEGLIAGTFDLERSGQRVQPQQVKAAAVSVDAGLAIPTDMAEPVEDQTAEEEDQPSDQAVASASPPSNASGTQQNGGTKKRRRRRRGRGGSHTQQPSEAVSANANVNQATREPSQHVPASPLQARPESDAAASESTAAAQTGAAGASTTPSRRRRRRRKPRGGSASSGTQASRSNSGEGVPEFAPESGSSFSTVTPNAPSEPVWSLGSDRAEAAAARTHETVGQMYYRREETLDSQEILPAGTPPKPVDAKALREERNQSVRETSETSAEAQSPQPQRRGWWQRTFKS